MRVLRYALLLVLLLAGAATAQVLEDPSGDVQAGPPGATQPADGWEATDLVALHIEESADRFDLTVQVVDLEGRTEDAREDVPVHQIQFDLGETGYRVFVGRPVDNPYTFAWLSRQDPGSSGYRYQEALDARLDVAEGTFIVEVPRDLLRDHRGAPAGQGHLLEDLHVVARAQASRVVMLNDPTFGPLEGGPLVVEDRMPDEGVGAFEVRLGGQGSDGELRLGSLDPYRASNGGAATVRYEVQVANRGGEDVVAHLEAQELPSGWEVEHPEAVEVPAGSMRTVGVTLTTPFGHQHGGSDGFRMEASSSVGDAWVELGIQYLDVAQPAGHHDTLWFHGHLWPFEGREVNPPLGGTNGRLVMNTLQEDPEATDEPIAGSSWGLPTSQYRWFVCLEPQLRLGLDFDVEDLGLLEATLTSERPLGASTLSGRLVHLGPGERMGSCFPSQWEGRETTELAHFTSAPVDFTGEAAFGADVHPTPESDRVPYEKDAALVLELVLDVEVPGAFGAAGPRMVPGASLQLPLNEYHDEGPAGIVGSPDEVPPPTNGTEGPEVQGKRSPAAAAVLPVVLAGLAAVWTRRARR